MESVDGLFLLWFDEVEDLADFVFAYDHIHHLVERWVHEFGFLRLVFFVDSEDFYCWGFGVIVFNSRQSELIPILELSFFH